MPHSPQPYPSFTLVMSSAPFAANDNMRLPAYRTSHLARFHPYSRAHPSLHQERLMTAVDCRFPKSPRGRVRGLASITPVIFPEDNGKAESKSVASTSSTESILRRQKLKTAAGRLSAVIVTLRRMYRGTSVKQAEQKLQFELMN
ncbi:hypothetical protein BGY98DRAFT_132669 [Russula aff. rugulosa BPL654]|nr:hypothetical protein BGY98DRAFT_132669 [Russula aff. rugulosa BPL654]